MRSIDRDGVLGIFQALAADLDRALELDFDALTTPEQLALLERCETLRRRLPAVEHPLVNAVTIADRADLGGEPAWVLADRLRITRSEARGRIADAADLGPRRALTGEPLPPALPATATAQRNGLLGQSHVQVIRDFFDHLPAAVALGTREEAETHLAHLASEHRPDELAKLAARLYDHLNPDGNFSDEDRARKRSLTLGKQDADGMTKISGHLDPQARATLDAVFAKLAGPGMCNPADDTPTVDGTPSQAAIDNDHRSAGQRNHDALTALGRAMLASGDLGQHNGLPATIIVSTSLAELETGIGKAHTGGGTWLPIRDVLRLAEHAHHYLRIF
ncbi:13E12 repeat family protein, partial [Mycobacterium sp. M1]